VWPGAESDFERDVDEVGADQNDVLIGIESSDASRQDSLLQAVTSTVTSEAQRQGRELTVHTKKFTLNKSIAESTIRQERVSLSKERFIEEVQEYASNDTPFGDLSGQSISAIAKIREEEKIDQKITDIVPPVIKLKGSVEMLLFRNSSYLEYGADVTDNLDDNLQVVITGSVNTTVAGTYTITYNATDSAGNQAVPVTRTVIVSANTSSSGGSSSSSGSSGTSGSTVTSPPVDTTRPVITISGPTTITIEVGTSYRDLGATANDNVDGSVQVSSAGTVNINQVGVYTITYTASDRAGNAALPVEAPIPAPIVAPTTKSTKDFNPVLARLPFVLADL